MATDPHATDSEIDGLFELPLDEFTAARDALAKRLRAEGERESAAAVKALRKPNLPAWAINRAVRAEPKAAARLLDAGEQLAAAQQEVVEGGDRARLREATKEHNAAVEALLDAVGAQQDAAGRGGAQARDRARETLRAAAIDEELRGELARGRVVRDREPVGFGGAVPATPKRGAKADDRRRRDAKRRLDSAERELASAERSVERERKRVEEAREQLAEAEAALAAADQAREELAGTVKDARAVLSELGG